MKTEFARYIGESNGKQMIYDMWMLGNISPEQARAVVTTYCIMFDVEVDTSEWDELMRDFWNNYNHFFDTFEEMDNFMCEDLV